ncbi:BBE domain-containing protein [Micromonospora marina]|uniref:BBE domain-containing protein n=1 Tax=Micromonospora marina TaxID=307120 RepID=UPI000B84E028|nr:BBE domain-containing protein [Micromonospora marina]
MRPALDGLYLSFESAFTPDRLADAFPPATLVRLRRIKAEVDPGNVFHQTSRWLSRRCSCRAAHRGCPTRRSSIRS